MKVSEAMTRDVVLAKPNQTLREVADIMSQKDIGALPVAEGDRLVGMITDRDIVIRAVAEGKGPDTKVTEIMTEQIRYCFEDEDLGDVSKNMAGIQMRRLPVMNRRKELVGILSLADMATSQAAAPQLHKALKGISQPM